MTAREEWIVWCGTIFCVEFGLKVFCILWPLYMLGR